MARILTPQIGRRTVVGGLASTAAMLVLPRAPVTAANLPLIPTPAQTTGPFYPVDWLGDADNDLVRVHGEPARAMGQVAHVAGRVLDASGAPVSGASVEIWQCDNNGRYRHPGDRRGSPRDSGFQGRGRAVTGADGGYSFRTIRPVPYPGRTPHIHFAIITSARQLVTQMYVAGEPLNEGDFLLNRIRDPRQRESVLVLLEPADRLEPGALAGTFDIVIASSE
ncbi:MAG: protocatechuate 3,4-dioxygenase [Hyphomicrobiaceae bacterium]|nr:protocatechuate 3,4-dioxygenase [Hyphomicrobiaceae bacterium]